MDTSDDLCNQIYNNMQLKTTEELLFILEQDDHEEWTSTALEVAKKIVIQRTGRLPDVPSTSAMYSSGQPVDWETVNWQAVSDKCNIPLRKWSLLPTPPVIFAFFLAGLAFSTLFSPANGVFKLVSFTIVLLLVGGVFGVSIGSHLKAQKAQRIVAKARVYLKDMSERNNDTVYEVGFAIKSAFILSEDGQLLMDKKWNGHQTLSVPTRVYHRLKEQDIVNVIFLSNYRLLGLLEDFEEK